jgi:hypothetical protein
MRNSYWPATLALAAMSPLVWAQEAPPRVAQPDERAPSLNAPIVPEPAPLECDLRASPDYVPGIDARGREVVPADVPYGQRVEIGSQVFVETRPRDRRLRGAGVIVDLPDLGAPACIPVERNPREHSSQ